MRVPRLFTLLLLMFVVTAGWPGGATPAVARINGCFNAGVVDLVMLPAQITTNVDEEFDLTLQVQAGTQTIDAISAFVNFDPAVLHVVSIAQGTSLPVVLVENFNNVAGTLDYEAGKLGPPFPSGTFTLATVRFRAMSVTQNSQIVYHCDGFRTTDVFRTGASILRSLAGTEVAVEAALAVTLASFETTAQADHVRVLWETVSEIDNQGFNLYRAGSPAAPQTLLAFIPSQAPGSGQGASYQWLDTDVVAGETYYYWLEAIDLAGHTSLHGPVSVTFQSPTAVGLTSFAGTNRHNQASHGWLIGLAVMMAMSGGWLLRRRRSVRE